MSAGVEAHGNPRSFPILCSSSAPFKMCSTFFFPTDTVLLTAEIANRGVLNGVLTVTFSQDVPSKKYIVDLQRRFKLKHHVHFSIFANTSAWKGQYASTETLRFLPKDMWTTTMIDPKLGTEIGTDMECKVALQIVMAEVCEDMPEENFGLINDLVFVASLSLPPNKPHKDRIRCERVTAELPPTMVFPKPRSVIFPNGYPPNRLASKKGRNCLKSSPTTPKPWYSRRAVTLPGSR